MKNDQLLKEIGVEPLKFFKDDEIQENFVFIGTIKNQKVLVKISKSGSAISQTYQSEVAAERILADSGVNRIKVISDGEYMGFYWVVREYLEGESLSAYGKQLTLYGYDILDEKVIFERDEIIKQVVLNIQLLQKAHLKHGRVRFPAEISHYDNLDYLPISISTTTDFYNQNKQVLVKVKKVPCINDLVPANIIFSNEKQVFLSDFSWFGLDNHLLDVTYLWLFLWRYPDWQKQLSNLTVVGDEDIILFKLNVIRIVLFWYDNFYKINLNKVGSASKERLKEYNTHKWLDYLKDIDKINDLLS